MATLFPANPAGSLPHETQKVFQALKSLPEGYLIWHHLAPWQPEAPDFLILNPQQQALLLKVSPANAQQAQAARQLLMLEAAPELIGTVEARVLAQFQASLSAGSAEPAAQGLREGPGLAAEALPLNTAILFPNLKTRALKQARPRPPAGAPHWLGQEHLKGDLAQSWADLFGPQPLNPAQVEQLRRAFTPEVIVPPALTVCPPRALGAGLTGFLLDYDQEQALKNDLHLGPQRAGLADDFRLSLVNGVAGSGKTLILLYRLRLLNELFPGKRSLVLTHNRPLIQDLEARFYRLTGRLADNIDWHTFMQWCQQHWPAQPAWVDPLSMAERRRLLDEIHAGHLNTGEISVEMLRSEIDWIKDHGLQSEAAYCQSDRRGRGFGLSQVQRQAVFAALQAYDRALTRRGRTDWASVPLQLRGHLQAGRVQPEPYDIILVDEAQFFAPVWFEIIQSLVKPQSGHLFLAADPTQGFLRQGVSWRSLGLEVRGRSTHLRHSYRTTREILDFATLFYRSRVPAASDDPEVLAPNLLNMPNGSTPLLIPLTSAQDEITRVAEEIQVLLGRQVPKGDLLVLHANGRGAHELIKALDRRLGRGTALDPKDSHPGNYVRVTTINAGAGLEAPIVFLAGLRELFEAEQSLRLAETDRRALVEANTRKIYMAATRAGQRLVFTYVGELPGILKQLLQPKG